MGFEHKSSAQSKELDMDCFEKQSKLTAQHIPHDVDDVSCNQVSKIRSLDELMASRYSCRDVISSLTFSLEWALMGWAS